MMTNKNKFVVNSDLIKANLDKLPILVENKEYKPGDLVYYKNKVYECKNAHVYNSFLKISIIKDWKKIYPK